MRARARIYKGVLKIRLARRRQQVAAEPAGGENISPRLWNYRGRCWMLGKLMPEY